MLRPIFIISLLFILFKFSFAQVHGTTESGNKVLLFDNGTWIYEEKTVSTNENKAMGTAILGMPAIEVDTLREEIIEPEELFLLPSPKLAKFFGEVRGQIRCRLGCSNNLGVVKINFVWEFPISDGNRYFGSFDEGTKVIFSMSDGQKVELIMGEEDSFDSFDRSNYSVISNSSQALTIDQITTLTTIPFRNIEVGWWRKKSEEYEIEISRLLMDMLPKAL